MKTIEFDDAAAFLAYGADLLARNEAYTALIYGVAQKAARLAEDSPGEDPPLFAAVQQGDVPALLAVMTPPHRIILHCPGAPDSDALRVLSDHLQAMSRPVPGIVASRSLADAFTEIWTTASGQQVVHGMSMAVYELREIRHPGQAPGTYRRAAKADSDLLQRWLVGFHREVFHAEPAANQTTSVDRRLAEDSLRLWEHEGTVVSLAGQTRPTPNGMSIGPVYTPPEHRGNGYASACVSALCREILDSGKSFCTLFADLANPTSNAIYQRIGFDDIGEFAEIDFE